jgi:alpha-tubulin suppressor-like RCC1 family protein
MRTGTSSEPQAKVELLATATLSVPSSTTEVALTLSPRSLAGHDGPCAIVAGKGVWCMKSDYGGVPDQQGFWIPGTETAMEFGVGRSILCTLDTARVVQCIGGTSSSGKRRVDRVKLPVESSRLVVGEGHACALGEDGEVRCWGDNGWGQSNAQQPGCEKKQTQNCYERSHTTPTIASWASGSTQFGVGANFSCAVVAGHLRCRGSVELDEVVPGEFRLASSSLGNFPCGATSVGVLCFAGKRVELLLRPPIATAYSEVCGRAENNMVACMPVAGQGKEREFFRLPPESVELVAGGDFICGRTSSGKVYCAGNFLFRRDFIGDVRGKTPWTQVFQPIALGKPTQRTGIHVAKVRDVVPGSAGLCALLVDKTVACWGTSGVGDGGDGSDDATELTVGQLVPGLTGVTELRDGPCAVNSDGTFCWGRSIERVEGRSWDSFDMYGARMQAHCALEKGTLTCIDNTKRKISVTNVTAVSRGNDHVCAIAGTERIVRCWGNFYNYFDAPGDGDGKGGSAAPPDPEPRFVPVGVNGATELVSGDYHACALHSAGKVSCWGDDTFRQLASTCPDPYGCLQPQGTAQLIRGLPAARQLLAAKASTCALGVDDKIRCWGNVVAGVGPDLLNAKWSRPHALPPLPARPRTLTNGTCFLSKADRFYCLGNQGRRWDEMRLQRLP